MDEFSDLEKKIYDALIDNKQNEVSQRVRNIEELLSRAGTYTVKLPDSNEMLDRFQRMEQQKIIKLNRSSSMNKKIIFIIGAAAVIFLGLFLAMGNGDKPKEPQMATSGEMKAKVTFVVGDVKVKSNSGDAGVKPEVGTFLAANQMLFTGDKSTLVFYLLLHFL